MRRFRRGPSGLHFPSPPPPFSRIFIIFNFFFLLSITRSIYASDITPWMFICCRQGAMFTESALQAKLFRPPLSEFSGSSFYRGSLHRGTLHTFYYHSYQLKNIVRKYTGDSLFRGTILEGIKKQKLYSVHARNTKQNLVSRLFLFIIF